MRFDVHTLMLAGSIVGALSGIILVGAWASMRFEMALLWWGLAGFAFSLGVGLIGFADALPQPTGAIVATGLIACAPPLVWGGTRVFHRRRAYLPVLAAGPLVWLISGVLTAGDRGATLAAAVGFVTWIAYLGAAAFELWRGRSEKLGARWYLAGLFVLHAIVMLGGIVDVLEGRFAKGGAPKLDSWFGIINIEGLLYFVGTAISMVGLAQERKENRAVHVASLDSLTGTANRGKFLDIAERLLRRCREERAPLSLVMFDLDHFKSINDTHGHMAGDEVIRIFVESTRKSLRPNDLIGRYGGEEFAVVLPGTTTEAAYVIADRIRHAFADTARLLGEGQIRATVSGGVAAALEATTIPELIDAADRALYRAKNLGRNRIQRSDETPPRDNVIRVA
ncbi:GGDEF domain-containing protein [soil metagenome]